MGLWEEAARHRAELDRANARVAQNRRQVAETVLRQQQAAVQGFIDGMHRLGIPPAKHRLWKHSRWGVGNYDRTRSTVAGWLIKSPRQTATSQWDLVVTTDGEVRKMLFSPSYSDAVLDLSEPQEINLDSLGETHEPLSEHLVKALANAMRGD
jgi:hypothetical protein